MSHLIILNFLVGMLKSVGLIVLFAIVVTWIYQFMLPPLQRPCGLPGGPPLTAPRVKLRDGRFLAYKEIGVPKHNAKNNIIFVHGFGNSRHDVVIAAHLPPVTRILHKTKCY